MEQDQHVLKLEKGRQKGKELDVHKCLSTMSILCFTKHKMVITIEFLGPCCPKIIYDMTQVEFAKHSLQIQKSWRALMQIANNSIFLRLNLQNGPHHGLQWEIRPQIHIWDDMIEADKFKCPNSDLNLNSNQIWN